MRRLTATLALVLVAGAWPAAPAVAHAQTAVQATTAGSVQADFNHDGAADLAVGVPFEDVGTIQDAGAVNVLYGTAGGLTGSGSQIFTQVGSAPEPGDQFGYTLAAGDFNHDGFADLAVGAPFEDAGSIIDAGAVSVLYGSAGGLTTTSGGQIFTQVGSPPEAGDQFGRALAAGDFNHDGVADLAVGAPLEDVFGTPDAGAVSVLYGSAAGLTRTGGQLFTQVGSPPEELDLFGFALAAGDFNHDGFADLAAGAPLEDVFRTLDAGAVSVLYGSASGLTRMGGQLFTQVGSAPEPSDQFGYTLAAGDFNHDGFADLAAGAPLEDVFSVDVAGAVSVLYGSAAKLTRTGGQIFTQVGSAPEPGDLFGFALATGDFNHDGFADLAAGAPLEDVFSTPDAGAVSVVYGSAGGLTRTGGQIFTQVGSAPEPGDYFGWSLASGDFNQDGVVDLAAGAPEEGVLSIPRAGAVSVLYGSAAKLTTTGGQIFTQDTPGVGSSAEANDRFGYALAAGDPDLSTMPAAPSAPESGAHRTTPSR
jgi:FG-GAP repeat